MQRLRLKAERNIGFCATVSARALNVDGTSLTVFFHQPGMRPQRIETSSSPPSVGRTTLIAVVGAMLLPRTKIERRLRQPVKLDQLTPGVALGEASAHGAILSHGRSAETCALYCLA
jgi:hypothetical protein